MESENHKIIRNFLLPGEKEEIIDWVKSINFTQSINNHHIKEVRKNLNGNSYMFDISKTSETTSTILSCDANFLNLHSAKAGS